MPNIPQINIGGIVYKVKDAELREQVEKLPEKLAYEVLGMATPTITGKYIKPGTGAITNIGTNQKVSEFTQIPEGTISFAFDSQLVNNPYILLVAFYSTNDASSFISGVAPTGQNGLIVTIPDGAKYYVVSDNADTSGGLHQLDSSIYTSILCDRISDIEEDVAEISSLVDEVITSEEITPVFIDGYYIKSTTGERMSIPTVTGFKCTDFILLDDNNSAIINNSTNITNNVTIALVAFYSSNNYSSFISAVAATGQAVNVDIPDDAKYVIYGSNTNSMGTYIPFNRSTQVISVRSRNTSGEDPEEKTAVLKCPTQYDLVVGDTFELFYKGIIKSFADEDYLVDASCDIGSNYKKRFIVTPTTAGTKTLALSLYDNADNLLDTKSVSLVIKSAPSNPGSVKNVLCVGDSLTVHGEWVKEMKRRIAQSGGTPTGFNLSNVHFIGTCEADGANYEGYGGWTFGNYNTANVTSSIKNITCTHDKTEAADQHSIYQDSAGGQWKLETISSGTIKIILVSGSASSFPATGTLTWVSGGTHHSNIVYTASSNAPGNPFWDDSQNKVNFATYASRIGASGIDYVLVLIGWNSAGNTKEQYKADAQTFINNVKASYPNAKIVLMGLQVPSRDGLGANYGASGTWSHYIGLLDFVHNLDEWYDELASSNSNVYHINISGQFDTEHNMPQSTRPVNSRNSETEVYQTNGVHPALSGYLQIADAATRKLVGLLSN